MRCRTTTQRAGVRPERIQLTKKYEAKLDLMNDRLARIEQLLHDSRESKSTSSALSPGRPLAKRENGVEYGLEATATSQTGDTGTQADSVAAKNVLEQKVMHDPDPVIHGDFELRTALDALRNVIHRAQTDAAGDSSGRQDVSSSSTGPPPNWQQVEAVLSRIKGHGVAVLSSHNRG